MVLISEADPDRQRALTCGISEVPDGVHFRVGRSRKSGRLAAPWDIPTAYERRPARTPQEDRPVAAFARISVVPVPRPAVKSPSRPDGRSKISKGTYLRALPRLGRGRPAHEVIAEHRPPVHFVVLVAVVQRPPAIPRRHRELASTLVRPEPGPPAFPVLQLHSSQEPVPRLVLPS
jgi:hypothetical protein